MLNVWAELFDSMNEAADQAVCCFIHTVEKGRVSLPACGEKRLNLFSRDMRLGKTLLNPQV